jgi:electron transfer flavoprotein beta subunit
MKVVVCVKQIPDPNSTGRLEPDTHYLQRDGVEVVMDPGDEFGVEAGLQLAEAHGGEVVVVSMGPERGLDAVRKALAMGAVKGILVSDPSLRGSDALTTARVYRGALSREEALDIMATEVRKGWWDGRLLVEFRGLLEHLSVTDERLMRLAGQPQIPDST